MTLDGLQKAIQSLERSFIYIKSHSDGIEPVQSEIFRAALIQNFEVAYEMSWKFVKRFLQEYTDTSDIASMTRKELFREAYQYKLIDNIEHWFSYYKMRNETSHTYNEIIADDVSASIEAFIIDSKYLLQSLTKRIEDDSYNR